MVATNIVFNVADRRRVRVFAYRYFENIFSEVLLIRIVVQTQIALDML